MAGKILSLLALPIIVGLHLVAAAACLSATGVIERGISRLFSDYFHGTLILDHARLDLFSGFRFEGVSFVPPGGKDPLFRARAITVNLNGPAILKGRFVPLTVSVADPIVTVVQRKDGTFSFESLVREERLGELTESETRDPLSLLITNGVLELKGEGPLVTGLEPFLEKGGGVTLHLPTLHCVDSGQEQVRWWFGCRLRHGALGDLQAEGHFDEQGVRDLVVEVEGMDLRARTFDAFASKKFEEIVDFTGFKGRFEARLDLARNEEGKYENRVRFGGFDLYVEDFPLELNGVEGSITYQDGCFILERAKATALGESMIADGSLSLKDGFSCAFSLTGENVPFGKELQHAVEAIGGGRDYRAFAPKGRTDFTYMGRVSSEDPRVRGDLYIRPKGAASASYEGYVNPVTGLEDTFPFRVYELDGEVAVFPERVELRSLKGYSLPALDEGAGTVHSERGRVLISGTVITQGEKEGKDITVRATDILLNEKLYHAVRKKDPATVQTAENLKLQGYMDLDMRIKGYRDEPAVMTQILDLKEVSFCYPTFPCPVAQVRGRVETDGEGRVRFENLKGFRAKDARAILEPDRTRAVRESGEIFFSGSLFKGELEELTIQGVDQHIDDLFMESLRSFLGPEFHLATDIFYEGSVDAVVDFDGRGEKLMSDVTVDLHLDRMSGGLLPLPLEDIRGTLIVDPDERTAEVHDLVLRAENGRFTFSRLRSWREDGMIALVLEATGRHMGLDTEVTGYVDEEVLAEWNLLGCRGLVDLKTIDLTALIDQAGVFHRLDAAADFQLNGASIGQPVGVENIHGDLSLHAALDLEKQEPLLVKGRSKRVLLEMEDRLFTDVEADFTIDEESLKFDRFHSAFYGGTIAGVGNPPVELSMKPPYAFKGSIVAKGTELRYFLDRSNYAFRNLAGKVDLTMDFEGEGDNPHRSKASGKLIIAEGSLFELPLFAKMARVMGSIFASEPPTFTGGEVTYQFQEGIITLTDVFLMSSLMELRGEGVMTLDGVDLYFIPSTGFVPSIPVVGDILNLIKNGILAFRATGPYSNIDVSYDTFVNRIFTEEGVPDEPRYQGRIDYTFGDHF